MRRSHAAPLATLLVAMLMLVACGTNSNLPATSATTPSSSSVKTTACSGLATINRTLTSLLDVKANTTVGDVRAAQAKVTVALNAMNAIASRIPAASGDMISQIRAANDQLTAKLQGYPDATPLGQTSGAIQDIKAKATLAQAKAGLLTTLLKCNS